MTHFLADGESLAEVLLKISHQRLLHSTSITSAIKQHHNIFAHFDSKPASTMTPKEALLLPIGEDDSFEILERPITALEMDIAEVNFDKAKAKTAMLAEEAESSILELQKLLEKTKTGTATLNDKDHLAKSTQSCLY
jgi:hypothetical protein